MGKWCRIRDQLLPDGPFTSYHSVQRQCASGTLQLNGIPIRHIKSNGRWVLSIEDIQKATVGPSRGTTTATSPRRRAS